MPSALDFPASPTLNQTYPNPPVTGQPTYKWDGSVWLAFDEETPGPESPDRYVKKNYIINGAMMVSQENGTTASTAGSALPFYPADQFGVSSSGVTLGAWGAQLFQIATPGGSTRRIHIGVATADTSVAAGDILWIEQVIEGLRVADLRFGNASAKTITVQFGVKAPAGTYGVVVMNSAGNRSYVAEYVIATGEANTDVVKSVTIPGDIAGTWPTDNTSGLQVRWGLMAGATFQQAAGAWGTGNAIGSPNQFNLMGTIGNVFELFDVSLTEGSVAPPFQVPDYASELLACQRYFYNNSFWVGPTAAYATTASFPVYMRATPVRLGGGTGYSVFALNNQFIAHSQTTAAYVAFTFNARL